MRELERHALAAYPEECCGILLGRREPGGDRVRASVSLVIRARNVDQGPRSRRFTAAPQDLLRAHLEARRREEEVVGYYHSHPDREARPSALDCRTADPGMSHVILSVLAGRVVASRSWYREAGSVQLEEEYIV